MKLNFFNSVARVTFTALFAVGALFSASVNAKDTVKVGVVSFLTGPAGGPGTTSVCSRLRASGRRRKPRSWRPM